MIVVQLAINIRNLKPFLNPFSVTQNVLFENPTTFVIYKHNKNNKMAFSVQSTLEKVKLVRR